MKEPVYIIDGSGYIFRAYYAIRPLTSSKGVPTNAVYGNGVSYAEEFDFYFSASILNNSITTSNLKAR